jgi:MFS family permease
MKPIVPFWHKPRLIGSFFAGRPALGGHGVALYGIGGSLRRLWLPWRGWGRTVIDGGFGAEPLNADIMHNLRWFRVDGILAHASESVVVAYLSLFVLALGATRAQIGLMSALASLSAAAILLPGALVVERSGRRKRAILLGGGGGARIVLVLLALLPLFASGTTAVLLAITLVATRSAFIHFGIPAWISLTADIVPLSHRGRYFSSRNIAMGVAGMGITYLVGQLISRAGAPAGYQLAMAIAFVIGAAATMSFARIREPAAAPAQPTDARSSTPTLLRHLRAHPDFLALCGVAAVWNISLGIAAPFFSVYMVENLGASASMVGALTVAATIASLPGQRLFGVLADRWGPRRLQFVTGFIVPLVPWTWALTRSPWHLIPVEMAAGFIWAGYNLASFTFLLTVTPEDLRSRYTALYQIVVTLGLAFGAALGGIVVTEWGLIVIFVVSGFGRLAGAVVFALFVHQPGASVATPRTNRRIARLGLGMNRRKTPVSR